MCSTQQFIIQAVARRDPACVTRQLDSLAIRLPHPQMRERAAASGRPVRAIETEVLVGSIGSGLQVGTREGVPRGCMCIKLKAEGCMEGLCWAIWCWWAPSAAAWQAWQAARGSC